MVSGDGLVAEVLQGLSARADAADALARLPIGIIPAGSGNGLCKSLLQLAGRTAAGCDPLAAARLISGGGTRALDLARVDLEAGSAAVPNPCYSFLSVSWGLIADVDIEADFLRPALGANRFDPWFERRMRYPRLYHGVLTYRLAGGGEWVELPGPFLMLWACNLPWMTEDSEVAPAAAPDDGLWHLVVGHGPELMAVPPAELRGLCGELASAMSTKAPHPNLSVVQTAAWRLSPAATGRTLFPSLELESPEQVRTAAARLLVKALGWGEAAAATAVAAAADEAEAGAAIERAVAGGAGAGATPYSDEPGFISVDGEWAHYGDVQVQVLPGRARVYAARPPAAPGGVKL